MNLRHLTDEALLQDTKQLVRDEHALTSRILHHLHEIERRRLYSDLRYASLYDYAIKELGYSEGAAYRRIQAARLLRQVPELDKKIESGLINLTHVSEASRFFKDNNIQRPEEKRAVLSSLESLSKKECQEKLAELSGKPLLRMIPVPLSEDTLEKVQRWGGLKGSLASRDELISGALDVAIDRTEKTKFKLRTATPPAAKLCVSGVNSETKREVYLRDEKKCTQCGSQFNLQFDHREPKALGGGNGQENIRLLCFACNQRSRIRAGL